MEYIGKFILNIPFMIQIHAESMKKSWEPFRIYQITNTANSAILSAWICIINGMSKMALPKYVLQFFSLISDGLGGVTDL